MKISTHNNYYIKVCETVALFLHSGASPLCRVSISGPFVDDNEECTSPVYTHIINFHVYETRPCLFDKINLVISLFLKMVFVSRRQLSKLLYNIFWLMKLDPERASCDTIDDRPCKFGTTTFLLAFNLFVIHLQGVESTRLSRIPSFPQCFGCPKDQLKEWTISSLNTK